MLEEILGAIWFIFPSYVGNAAATLGGGRPLDFGRYFPDGRRILGDGKTFRGFGLGVLGGTFTGALQHYLGSYPNYPYALKLGLLLGFGALFGDALESFLKRRLGKERGTPFPPFDQLDLVVGALLLYYTLGRKILSPFTKLEISSVLILVVLTPLIHLGTNFVSYKLGGKDVWW
ncbi:MAG: CDP-2,3-bis-(O-geranylgeranyl)-sn-glycerol synthase [Candidatus Methanofastidiosia archaeon]